MREPQFDREVLDVMNLVGVSLGKVQHLCRITESGGHVGQAGALG